MDKSTFLFAYGTLMRGWKHDAARFLHQKSKFLGSAFISGKLYDLGDYPGLVYDPNSNIQVKGQLFELSDPARILSFLDYYEGANPVSPEQGLFLKEFLPVIHEEAMIPSWVYTYNQVIEEVPLIHSGDYQLHVQNFNRFD